MISITFDPNKDVCESCGDVSNLLQLITITQDKPDNTNQIDEIQFSLDSKCLKLLRSKLG